MTCGRCGQDETKCGECWKTAATGGRGRKMAERNHVLIQGLLRSGIPLDEVVEKHKLKINRSKRHSNLVQFKYDQIESDLSSLLVRQCRGLILDEKDNWEIVARPFDKFFNYGESEAATIDWKTARVLEKLDGTCCFLYYYQGWHVATLGSCDASGPVGGYNMTFADLFWEAFFEKKYVVPETIWSGVTFIFELMTPYNRVVVPHKENNLILLGARVAEGSESSVVGTQGAHGYDTVQEFVLNSIDAIAETFVTMEPTAQEGYVVVDGKYNRIKVKHPGYVRIHQMKDSFTIKNIVDCVRNGEDIEFLNYFPEHKDVVNMVKESFMRLIDNCLDWWALTEHITNQKAFAEQVKDLPISGILFAVRNGKRKSIIDALQQMHLDNLVDMLEVKHGKAA
jgi:hypothetical protein